MQSIQRRDKKTRNPAPSISGDSSESSDSESSVTSARLVESVASRRMLRKEKVEVQREKSLAAQAEQMAHDDRMGQPPVEKCASHRYWRLEQCDGHVHDGPSWGASRWREFKLLPDGDGPCSELERRLELSRIPITDVPLRPMLCAKQWM